MIFHTNAGVGAEDALGALPQELQEDFELLKPNVLLETLKGFLPDLVVFGIKVLLTLVIFFLGSKVIKALYRMLERSFKKVEMEAGLQKFLLSVFRAVMYCLLVFIIAGQVGISSASIVALLGSASIAAGLAIQGSLANFAGGVLILLMRPFKAGDYIVSKEGEGTVRTIGLVYTILTTADNKQVVIPNGTLSNSTLTNVTAMEKRRVDILIGISYNSDLKRAKEVLESVLSGHKEVRQEEGISVFVNELAESAVVIGGRAWTATGSYWTVKTEVMERLKYAFENAGIEIPYVQTVVHLKPDATSRFIAVEKTDSQTVVNVKQKEEDQ